MRTARDRVRVESVGEPEVRLRDVLHVGEQREECREVRVAHAARLFGDLRSAERGEENSLIEA